MSKSRFLISLIAFNRNQTMSQPQAKENKAMSKQIRGHADLRERLPLVCEAATWVIAIPAARSRIAEVSAWSAKRIHQRDNEATGNRLLRNLVVSLSRW
jgi:hypothetical protein